MRWGILGPLLVVDDAGRAISAPTGRLRVLLAVLLTQVNHAVAIDELSELLWDGTPPSGAARTVRVYVGRLRRVLGPLAAQRIVTQAPGYLCRVGQDELDLLRFEELQRRAGMAAHEQDWAGATELLTDALALWRGTPLADVPSDLLREQHLPRLEQLHAQALEDHAESELRLGHDERLLPQLRDLADAQPMNERVHALRMIALARSGRRAQALADYHQTRRVLVEELGIEPGPELRKLYGQILTGSLAPSAGLSAEIVRTDPGGAANRSSEGSASAWTGVIHTLNTLPVSDHVELLTQLHRHFHDGLVSECLAAVGDLPPGHRRVVVGTIAYLDASRREPGVRRLLASARTELAVRREAAKRNAHMSELITPDFAEMGSPNPAHMAGLWVGMAAEVALAESAEDARLPELRAALLDYLGRWTSGN